MTEPAPEHLPGACPGAWRGTAMQTLSVIRRKAGLASLPAFITTYLPHHARLPFSRMHTELCELLDYASIERGSRIAVAAPRGHAKSTIVSCAYVLWSIVRKTEPYILLISATADQAEDFLSFVKTELSTNQRLIEDFPESCEGGEPPGPSRWRRGEIITRSGVKVTALGAGRQIRGRRHHSSRPSLIILDDAESDMDARSEEQRLTRRDWFSKSVLKAGEAGTNVVVVGTIMHHDALLARLVEPTISPGWEARVYRAVESWSEHPELWDRWESVYAYRAEHDSETGPKAAAVYLDEHRESMLEGTRVLWSERESYEQLMLQRLREGRASFDSEKQNQPVNPDECCFREEEFVYWDDTHGSAEELRQAIGDKCQLIGACDPSLGKLGKGRDDSAIITLLRDRKTGTMYVVDADIRRRTPERIIEDVLEYERMHKYTRFGMETNQFQSFLADELQRRGSLAGVNVPVKKINHSTDKLGRIQRLQPLISAGRLQLSRRHGALLEQLRQFPMAAHDDGPDALEMAVECAVEPVRPRVWVIPRRKSPLPDRRVPIRELDIPDRRVPNPLTGVGQWWSRQEYY